MRQDPRGSLSFSAHETHPERGSPADEPLAAVSLHSFSPAAGEHSPQELWQQGPVRASEGLVTPSAALPTHCKMPHSRPALSKPQSREHFL